MKELNIYFAPETSESELRSITESLERINSILLNSSESIDLELDIRECDEPVVQVVSEIDDKPVVQVDAESDRELGNESI